ncbi:hypothetical protein ACIBG0_40330 [Nocardia sp. NPDC050630]|uniref:hypothetical protein n=1 Tax=Nocardia sp. NPDC050630 TaxID=3364321 RepID=UPI00378A9162
MTTSNLGARFRRAARPTSAFGRNSAPGTTVTGRVTAANEEPKLKFDGAPDEVELDDDGKPVMQLIVTLATAGGPRNLYVTWRMEQAIGAALDTAGVADFRIGDTLAVTYTGPDPDYPKARLFTAVYTPAAGQNGA